MSIVVARTVDAAAPWAHPIDRLRAWLPYVLILAVAIAERHFVIGNADVSWLITASEKILDGQRLYVDVIELNPPAAVFLYLPAVALARAIGCAPEIVVDGQVLVAAAASLFAVAHIVRRSGLLDNVSARPVAVFAFAALTILPAQTFGEREHFALIAALPAIATFAIRAGGAKPLLWQALIAGLSAGVTVCIKPHFALPIGLAASAAALHARSWRVLFVPENWCAAAVAAVYAVCVAVFYPAFFTNVMPAVADLYLPIRLPLGAILGSEPMLLWAGALLLAVAIKRGTGPGAAFAVLLMASTGFAAAYVIQGKGWPYHCYPALALALIALDLAGAYRRSVLGQARWRDRLTDLGSTAMLWLLAAACFARLNVAVDTRAATALVKRIASHPAIIAISADPAVGHPLVREVGGRWASRSWGYWQIEYAGILQSAGGLDPVSSERLSAYVKAERQQLIDDIRDGKPDIILTDNRVFRWGQWIAADRQLSALLAANYREAGSADGITILERAGN